MGDWAAVADILAPPTDRRVWYCDRPDCDGQPHPGAHWCQHPVDSHPAGAEYRDCRHARTDQRPPVGPWLVWAYIAGRGTGKTRAMAEWVTDQVLHHHKKRGALVGRTPADVRDVMIEGESGLVAVGEAHGFRPVWQPTKRRLVWPNGAQAFSYSAEVGAQLRGPQHDFAWADEPSAWTDAPKGDRLDTAWNNMLLGLRTGADPRCGFSTTPKPVALVKQVLDRPTTARTHATTYANLDNLAPTFQAEVLAAYEGTRIGRQELMGEMLEDVEGALWSLTTIERDRVPAAPEMVRIVVGVDPAVTSGEDSDLTGIVVAGKGADGHAYILADRTIKASPAEWALTVVAAYDAFAADRVVVEQNQGHDLLQSVLRTVRPGLPIEKVNARRGKRTRAEPISALYEQGRVHHVGSLPQLEDQMTSWVPDIGDSPDRVDSLVWAVTALKIAGGDQGAGFLEAWRQMVPGAKPDPKDPAPAVPAVAGCAPGKTHFFDRFGCVNCGCARPEAA